jgi:geranylgeranyl reductase family protein
MTRTDFDVIVAGAGAGGAAAAYYLNRAGLRALVVEKARLPRYKACGGAIPRPVLARFPLDFSDVIRAAPSVARFMQHGQLPADVDLSGRPVAMVVRSEFDAFLLDRSGAEVLQDSPVVGVTETPELVEVHLADRSLTSRYLVGADGAASQVARALGLRRHKRLNGALEMEVPLAGREDLQEAFGDRAVFSLAGIPWSYAWVFPKGDHLSVGIARFRPGRVDLRSALLREMDRLRIPVHGLQFHGHPLPCYQVPPWRSWSRRPQERLSTRRCVLVGDAAGLVDPFFGEGIRHAIASARLAAEAIARDDLAGYEAAIWQELGHNLSLASMTANLYYRLPWLCYELGVRNPAVIQQFVDLLSERCSYEGIGARLVAATVRWPFNHRKGKTET